MYLLGRNALHFRNLFLVLLFQALSAFGGPLEEARSFIDQKDYESARPLLETAVKNPDTKAQASLLLTSTCSELGDWKSAVKYGEIATELLPENSDAHYQYAVALRTKMTNTGKMKAMFTIGAYKDALAAALKFDPHNTDALSERIGYLINAPGIAGGDLDDAEKELINLEKLDWKLAKQMQITLGVKREDSPAAIRVAREILERYPEDVEVRWFLGLLLQQNNQFREADAQFAQIVDDQEYDLGLRALYQRARSRLLGDYELEEAIRIFELYLSKLGEPSPRLASKAVTLWRIGMTQEKLGHLDKARVSYRAALKLEPDLKEAKKALKKLK